MKVSRKLSVMGVSVAVSIPLSILVILAVFLAGWVAPAKALDLDWKGQFQSEAHFLLNYSLEKGNPTNDPTLNAAGGYYIPGTENGASFQTMVLKLRPSVIVNDNVYLRSEWWVGDPVFGLFGSGAPYAVDSRSWYSSGSRGSVISAQRLWAEVVTDVGMLRVGRMPLHWGLGLVWNSGDALFDRYLTTADGVRWTTQFGAFSVSPTIVQNSIGNAIAGSGGVWNWSLELLYHNLDEEMELGVQYQRRLAASNQDASWGYATPMGVAGFNYGIWDIFARKRWNRFSLGLEVPIASGVVGGLSYQAVAAATEGKWRPIDEIETSLRVGYAPGQQNSNSGENPTTFGAFVFHPNYRLGLILFQYQLANFLGPQTLNSSSTQPGQLRSPYDNPITNTVYGALGLKWEVKRWTFSTTWIVASALESAAPGKRFYNTWSRRFADAGEDIPGAQARSLGWEMDYGVQLQWDDALTTGLDFGLYVPGGYYEFTNTASNRALNPLFAAVFKLGVVF